MAKAKTIGRPCEHCGRVQLLTATGREYCLACADAISDAPLVPVTMPIKQIWRIKSAFRAYSRTVNDDEVPIPKRARDPNARRPDQRFIPMLYDVERRARGGPHFKLSDEDLTLLRKMMTGGQAFTMKRLAESFNVHPKTIRRALKKLGLKLPARRRR